MMDPSALPPPSIQLAPEALAPAYDQAKVAGEVMSDYQAWKSYRQPHEGTWFVNAAMLRGQQHVLYDQQSAQLVTPDAPSYAVRIDFNKIMPKHRARMAKFFKNRPKPLVVPASSDYQDLMDARMTTIALQYQLHRLRFESCYRDARQWAAVGSKAFLWLGYDETIRGRVTLQDEITGEERIEEAELGDLTLEVGNVWETLVADPSQARIGHQAKILRVRAIPRKEAERRYPELGQSKGEGGGDVGTAKSGEDRIAGLTSSADAAPNIKRENQVLLLEHYTAPCGKYPKGRKVVVCDNTVVRYEEALPFEFYTNPVNPYPCVEFSDTGSVGQFWNTTWIEQLIPLQRLLNRLLELATENAEAVSRPKAIFYKQHQLPDGAFTSAAGEVLTLTHVPGLPEPRFIQAQSVSGDVWNLVNLVLRQIDDVSQIHTASEGGSGGAESGYQTNLLQEATDAVHAPDIRGDELAIEELAWKMRRIMKLTWDVPRLVAMAGEGHMAEAMEFSNRQIDDAAEVRIQIGSMLPDLKAAKAQTALNYYKEGIFGDPTDPAVRRKALAMIDQTGYDVIHEEDRLDEDEARRENQTIFKGGAVEPAKFHHRHPIHIEVHESKMKTPEWALMPKDQQLVHIAHLLTHYDFTNLPLALGLRQQYGLSGLPIAAPPPPPAPAPMPGQPPPSGAPSPMMPPASGAPAPAPLG